jgi:predicted lipoprotein with Yx(FWY)xxD motif
MVCYIESRAGERAGLGARRFPALANKEDKMRRDTPAVALAAAFTFLALVLFTLVAVGSDVITNREGMTLYTFDRDTTGVSHCTGPCAEMWPPVRPSAELTGKGFGVIKRADGSEQVTYQGKPIYLYSKDSKPGDAKGDGVGGVWHAVRSR